MKRTAAEAKIEESEAPAMTYRTLAENCGGLSGGRGVPPASSNINGLDDVSGPPHEMPHNLLDLSRSLRFRARRKPYQQLAGELAMNLTYYAEHPTPELWDRIKTQFEQLERMIAQSSSPRNAA